MNGTEWYPGLLAVIVVTGAFVGSGLLLRRMLLPEWSGTPALLAGLTLAVSGMVVVATALGVVGLLTRPALVISAVLGLAVCWIVSRGRPIGASGEDERGPERESGSQAALGIGIAALLLVALEWVVPTLNSLEAGMYGGDTLWYHMPFSAHFVQTASINEFVFVDTQYLNWFYPQNSELLHAVFVLLLGSDFLSPVINYFWLALAVLAGWCIGRPYGAALPGALGVTLLMSMEVISSRQPGSANNDAMVIALLLAAVAFAATAWNSTPPPAGGRRRGFPDGAGTALTLGGLAVGLAIGTKLTAIAPGGLLLVGFVLLASKGSRVRTGLAVGGAAAVAGGYWYLRNLIQTGNPLPWLSIGPFERAGELTGREPRPILDYLTDLSIWSDWLAPGLSDRLGPFWLTLLLGAIVGLGLGFASRDRLRILVAASGAAALIAYILIPLGAAGPEGTPTAFAVNVRYVTPALAIGFVLLALPPTAGLRRSWTFGVAWLYLLALILAFAFAGVTGFDRYDYPFVAILGAFLVLGVLPVAIAVLWVTRSKVPLALAASGWLVALILLGGYQEARYAEYRYSSASPRYPVITYPAIELAQGIGPLNDLARGLEGERIGLSGSLGQYYQYGIWGPDLSNEVSAVGIETGRQDLRPPSTCREWLEALRKGKFDLVVTSPPVSDRDPGAATTAVEEGWIGRGKAEPLLESERVAVWRLDDRSTAPEICLTPDKGTKVEKRIRMTQ